METVRFKAIESHFQSTVTEIGGVGCSRTTAFLQQLEPWLTDQSHVGNTARLEPTWGQYKYSKIFAPRFIIMSALFAAMCLPSQMAWIRVFKLAYFA